MRKHQYATDKSTNAGYIVTEAKRLHVSPKNLLALSRQFDPFYSDHPTHLDDAKWFKEIWNTYGRPGAHLRGIHYAIQALQTVKRPDGRIYRNTVNDWQYLCVAGERARYNGLIDPTEFRDRRNRAAEVVHAERRVEPEWSPDYVLWDARLKPLNLGEPSVEVEGYDYAHGDQAYMVEVWIEKTTMADHLEELQKEFGFNLVQGGGFESVTRIDEFVYRALHIRKPVRIFYISDLDVNGVKMPVSVARQIEFWNRQRGLDLDVKLKHLMLTREQADEYDLPAEPLRANTRTEKGRKIQQGKHDAFVARHGEGTVELDALEGLHPGEFSQIVREAVEPYFDPELKDRLEEAEEEAESALEDVMDEIMEKHQAEISECEEEINEASGPARERLKLIMESVEGEIEQARETLEIPERAEPDADGDDEEDWLFDSSRGYGEQLEHYKRTDTSI